MLKTGCEIGENCEKRQNTGGCIPVTTRPIDMGQVRVCSEIMGLSSACVVLRSNHKHVFRFPSRTKSLVLCRVLPCLCCAVSVLRSVFCPALTVSCCVHLLPWLCPAYTLTVSCCVHVLPWLYPAYTLTVSCCVHAIPWLYPAYTLTVLLCPCPSLAVPRLYTVSCCVHILPWLYPPIHWLWTAASVLWSCNL